MDYKIFVCAIFFVLIKPSEMTSRVACFLDCWLKLQADWRSDSSYDLTGSENSSVAIFLHDNTTSESNANKLNALLLAKVHKNGLWSP